MTPVQEIEFVVMIANAKKMTISLPKTKLQLIKQMYQDLYQNPETRILEFIKALRHLTSTILAILPAKLHCCFLQQQQIQALKKTGFYCQVLLNKESQLELLTVDEKHRKYNGRALIQLPAQALLQTDASLKDLGAVWEGLKTGRTWTQQKRRMYINKLELLALKLALETFLKAQEIESLHIQEDNIVALTYLLKMRCTKNL